jgi:hypothetical protein
MVETENRGIVNIRSKIEGFRALPVPFEQLVLTHPISLKKTEYPEKPLEFICYRPSKNLKFKFSEKPLTNLGGFFVL